MLFIGMNLSEGYKNRLVELAGVHKKPVFDEQAFLQKLEADSLKFREKMELEYDWADQMDCFKGQCNNVADEFNDYLTELGYKSEVVAGYYTDVSDDYVPNHWDDDVNNNIYKYFNKYGRMPKLTHVFNIVNDKYIVDITADQFHPSQENDYRVVITSKKDKRYKLKL